MYVQMCQHWDVHDVRYAAALHRARVSDCPLLHAAYWRYASDKAQARESQERTGPTSSRPAPAQEACTVADRPVEYGNVRDIHFEVHRATGLFHESGPKLIAWRRGDVR